MVQSAYNKKNAYRKHLGKFGEQIATQALMERGLQVLARNWRYGRQGELDIVMLSPNPEPTLVFVEVKTRTNRQFGNVVESLGIRQQGRLLLLAEAFIQAHPEYAHLNQRFDLMCISPHPGRLGSESVFEPLSETLLEAFGSNAGYSWYWHHLPDILSS